jgi:hypothetical protein
MVATKDGIGPLLKVEAVKTMVSRTGGDGLGGGTPPMVAVLVGIGEFLEEVASFVSIAACDTIWRS